MHSVENDNIKCLFLKCLFIKATNPIQFVLLLTDLFLYVPFSTNFKGSRRLGQERYRPGSDFRETHSNFSKEKD